MYANKTVAVPSVSEPEEPRPVDAKSVVNAQDAVQVSRSNALLLLKMKAYEQCGREWQAQFYAVDFQIREELAEHGMRYQRYEERLRM